MLPNKLSFCTSVFLMVCSHNGEYMQVWVFTLTHSIYHRYLIIPLFLYVSKKYIVYI